MAVRPKPKPRPIPPPSRVSYEDGYPILGDQYFPWIWLAVMVCLTCVFGLAALGILQF